jgi:hypothetical protein
MDGGFDIFRVENDGGLLWQGAAESLEDAQSRAKELSARLPGDHMIIHLRTGMRLKVNADGTTAAC